VFPESLLGVGGAHATAIHAPTLAEFTVLDVAEYDLPKKMK